MDNIENTIDHIEKDNKTNEKVTKQEFERMKCQKIKRREIMNLMN